AARAPVRRRGAPHYGKRAGRGPGTITALGDPTRLVPLALGVAPRRRQPNRARPPAFRALAPADAQGQRPGLRDGRPPGLAAAPRAASRGIAPAHRICESIPTAHRRARARPRAPAW